MNRIILLISLLAPIGAVGQSYKITEKVSVKLNTEQLFPAPPTITWASLNQADTVVNSATFLLRVCVANFSEKTDSLRVFVNKQELAKERSLRIGKEANPCPDTYYFTRSINLGEGENVIRVVAANPTGVSESRRTVKNFKPETRLALVIGNAAYPGEDALKNPVNDATDMGKALEKLGFKVMLKTNVNRKEMALEINRFAEQLATYQVGLFYYAGHGIQIRGENYLVPIDAIPTDHQPDEAEIKTNCVPADDLFRQLDNTDALAKIIILDACRNNPFEGPGSRAIGGDGGLAQMRTPIGSLIAYATSPGKKANDGSGKNGLYTEALLHNIQQPNMPLVLVFQNVNREVQTSSRNTQAPWYNTSGTGDFYFLRR
ncbi:hypothetical protein BH09BAC4_BH09BAC4_36770 [soil metagenome]